MANETFAITADAQQLKGLDRAMFRLEKEAGKTTEESVKWAAWYIAKAAKATAKKAPRKRRLLKNRGTNKAYPVEDYPFFVYAYTRSDKRKKLYIRGQNGAIDLDQRRKVVITRAGLLKSSWHWAGKKAGRMSGSALAKGKEHYLYSLQKSKISPSAKLGSKLGYADLAWTKTKRGTKDDIVKRAANAMEKWVERRLDAKANKIVGAKVF